MDLKTFAADDFDTKKWINNAWRSSGNQDKEVFVANTVSRLQLYMKQLTNSLDETTTQIITSVPRVLQDASTLQLEGSMLQQQLFQLEQKLVGVQRETGHSIESLQRIDRLKSRLESASSALAEGDKWAALAASLGDTLDAGVPAESERLRALTAQASALAASLEVLTDTPDYEQRKLQLETLFTKLEAAVSAPFLSALSKMDTERTEAYAAMLRAMHRSPSVARCARRSFSELVRAQWTRGEAHTTLALARSVAGQLGAQVEWLTDVLKCETPLKELFELYTDLLPTLEPSPSKVVTAALKHCSTPQEGILYLTDVRQDLDLLLNAFRTLLESPKTKETMPQATIKQLGRAVYAPLRELMPAYLELQVQVFNGYLETAELDQTDNLESARAIQALVDRCEDWLSNAHNAARKIAGNAVYPYFMPAVEHIGTSISAALERTAQRIHSAHAAGAVTSRGLWGVFPAAAALSHSAAAMADVLAAVVTRVDQEMDAENTPTQCPLDSLATLLQTDGTSHKQDSLSAAILRLRKAKRTSTALSISLLATPTTVQIAKVPTLDVWSNNDALSTDLPDFAISPQEYITEVGQYLMTLPQHLEMHLPEKQAWELLNEICNQTCEMYAEKILNIRNMDELGTKRCLTDIVYLSSVVEDLGSTITPSLTNLEKSLRAATPAPTSD